MADLRLTTWIDEDDERYFDLRDYSPDGTGMGQFFGNPILGPWLTAPGNGILEAEMREHLAIVRQWSPSDIDTAIAAALTGAHGRG